MCGRLRRRRDVAQPGGKMTSLTRNLIVASSGLTTTVLTAILVAAVEWLTGVNLFALQITFVIPFGALLCGIAASSGFFIASLMLHSRASLMVYAEMIGAAAACIFLIFFLEYQFYTFDDGSRIAAAFSYFEFVSLYLSSLELRILGAHIEAGTIGYVLTAYQGLAFMLGGWMMFYRLEQTPACTDCGLYRRQLIKRCRHFDTHEEIRDFRGGLTDLPASSADIAARLEMGEFYEKSHPLEARISIFECPGCQQWLWRDGVYERETSIAETTSNMYHWEEKPDLRRDISMRPRPDLLAAMKAQAATD